MVRDTVPVGMVPGTVSAQRMAGTLHCVETRYVADQRLPPHAHATANLVLVLAGSFVKRTSSALDACVPGAVFYQPPAQEHSNVFHGPGGRCLTFEIDHDGAARYASLIGQPRSRVVTSPLLAGLATRLDAEFQTADDASHLAIEGLVMETLAELARFEPRRGASSLAAVVGRAWRIIQLEFERPLGLDDIASRVGAHPVSLARAFRRQYRMTLGEAIRRERVAVACRLLAEGELSIAQIATRCGFADQSHLARVFRRVMGTSPSGYRALHG